MQVTLSWICNQCEDVATLLTDTSAYGLLVEGLLRVDQASAESPLSMLPTEAPVRVVVPAYAVELRCPCGHVAAGLGLGYRQDHPGRQASYIFDHHTMPGGPGITAANQEQ